MTNDTIIDARLRSTTHSLGQSLTIVCHYSYLFPPTSSFFSSCRPSMLSTRNHKRKFKRTSIQQAVRDGLARTEQRLAQSESAREQQATQLAELNNGLNYSNSTARSARAPHMRRRPPTPPPPPSNAVVVRRLTPVSTSTLDLYQR